MANPNQMVLVVEVQTDAANAKVSAFNKNLNGVERTAVSVQQHTKHGFDAMAKSMAQGVVVGALVTDTLRGMIDLMKEWSTGAAQLAARNEMLAVVNTNLAKSNGYSAESIERLVDRIKGMNITTQAARNVVNRMMVAQLDLSKAVDLTRMAQDAARVAGQNSSQALEGIIHGITTQQVEVLRTYGINVIFEREFNQQRQRLGRDLTDVERKNTALNKALGEAPKLHGTYAASLGTVSGALLSLQRVVEEARFALGQHFLPEMRKVVYGLTDLMKWVQQNSGAFASLAKAIAAAALGAAIGKFIGWMIAARTAVNALSLAMTRNPVMLIAIGATVAGQALHEAYNRTQEWQRSLSEVDEEGAKIRKLIGDGKTVADLEQMGYTTQQMRAAFEGARKSWGMLASDIEADSKAFGERIKVITEKELKAVKDQQQKELAQDIGRHMAQATRSSREFMLSAQRSAVDGPAKAILEVQKEIEQLTTFVDEKGVEHRFGLTAAARLNLEKALQAKIADLRRDESKKLIDAAREEAERKIEFDGEVYQRRLDFLAGYYEEARARTEQAFQFEERRADFSRDAQMRGLEMMDAQTLEQKVAVEQQKSAIEIEHARRTHEIRMALFDMETRTILSEAEIRMRTLQVEGDLMMRLLDQLDQDRQRVRVQQGEEFENTIRTIGETGVIREAQIIRDHNRDMFDSLKRSAEGVFDALKDKSKSVFGAIGSIIKTAILTAMKEVITSRIAAMFMQLFTGTKVGFSSTGSGPLGRLGAALGIGAVPVFGQSAGGVMPGNATAGGLGGAVAAAAPMMFLPGGGFGTGGGFVTPTFTGAAHPLAGVGGTAAATGAAAGGAGGKAGLAGMLAGYKGILTDLGNIGSKTVPMGSFGGTATTAGPGVGGMAGGAMLLGGATLFGLGLKRGGVSGLAMTTAGGALFGAKFGPVGAAIGAAVGFGAGLIRMFIKGAQEKAREKIKALYGVDVSDKGLLRQFIDTAKQQFGGNVDMAIRSPGIRDLIELYAMSTGQTMSGMSARMTQTTLIQSGGSLFQQSAGSALSTPVTGGLERATGAAAPTSSPVVVQAQLDGAATVAFLQGQAVEAISDNPRPVQMATIAANRANIGRRESLAQQISPGTVVT